MDVLSVLIELLFVACPGGIRVLWGRTVTVSSSENVFRGDPLVGGGELHRG